MSPILGFAALSFFVGICNASSLVQKICNPVDVRCQCGEEFDNGVRMSINQCYVAFLGGSHCAPCESVSFHCAKFQTCQRCYRTQTHKCKSCPPMKYGTWCELLCDCKNGGSCDRNGKCLCAEGFKGPKCQNERKSKFKCGRPSSSRTALIRNGNVTKPEQWPWQTAIYHYDWRWTLVCGGSILKRQWIVTAAHCVALGDSEKPMSTSSIRIFVGKYHRSLSEDGKSAQELKVEAIYVHSSYNSFTHYSDIALIKLKQPMEFNYAVSPVCLPSRKTSQENIIDGKLGVVTGWGLNEHGDYSEVLMQAELPVVTQRNCQESYDVTEHNLFVGEKMFCAGHRKGFTPNSCIGDSGGPMVFRNPFSQKTTQWVIEGIVSWGGPDSHECGKPYQHSGYTMVSKFSRWIKCHFTESQPTEKCKSIASFS